MHSILPIYTLNKGSHWFCQIGSVFRVILGESPIEERLVAKKNAAFFSDHGGPLSVWLKRFNPTEQNLKGWPAYAYDTSNGRRLTIVSKVGLINLQQSSSETEYTTSLGKNRAFTIRFSSSNSPF